MEESEPKKFKPERIEPRRRIQDSEANRSCSGKDFQGINPEVIVHRLNVDPMMRPVKQKKRSFGVERNKVIEEEVKKLLEAGYVSKVQYTEWLANVVVVPKIREMAYVHRFHRFEQGMPKRSIPFTTDRSLGGFNCRI
ncbi:UNVERIFIED_CONTAM: hypothetical protein Sradi_4294300 [Sesamum radiatum]|uniref:Reverse transcriptase n=1 Tax=Sesamum radiatum TaxID=300843 RepID=A0AAW2NMD2_SESRA